MNGEDPNKNAPGASDRGRWKNLEHESGLEPATPTLARDDEPEDDRDLGV